MKNNTTRQSALALALAATAGKDNQGTSSTETIVELVTTPTMETPAAPVEVAPVETKATKKQHPLVCFPTDKVFIQELKESLELRNDMEALRVVRGVAEAFRFDEDGNDRFKLGAQDIEASRDSEKSKRDLETKIADLESLAAKLGLDSAALEIMKGQMLAKLNGTPAAAASTEG